MSVTDTTRLWNNNPFRGMTYLQGDSFPKEDMLISAVMDSGEQYVITLG